MQAHRTQVPTWFPVDQARDTFAATYPFHPTLLSVFERKWQALPRFQQTRGILRVLALWVSNAYQSGYQGAHKDPLISIGTAPLDDAIFRQAVLDQLGTTKLEGAVTTDVMGKKDSHATRLDKEAVETIRKARLHQKVATTIFFESNGGQARGEATQPEVRLAVAEPDLDIGNVDTALEALSSTCYYLSVEKNRYRFSLSPNLNKLLADRRASVQPPRVEERIRREAQDVFAAGKGVDRIYFPEKSGQIPDTPRLAIVVLPPDQAASEKATRGFIDSATREHGSSSRTFKSALLWAVPEGPEALREEARKALAWEDIAEEESELRLDDTQKRQLAESLKKAQRDTKEAVWRTYKNVLLLGKDGDWKVVDLGLVHSSAAPSLVQLIIERLSQGGDIEEKGVSASFLVRNWPPAFREWSTRSVRDAFFASPAFPRLLNAESVRDTIARGVDSGMLAYVGKKPGGGYDPFHYQRVLPQSDLEISEDVYIIQKEVAEGYLKGLAGADASAGLGGGVLGDGAPRGGNTGIGASTSAAGGSPGGATGSSGGTTDSGRPGVGPSTVSGITWRGEIPPQRWMNFYTKVLSKFSTGSGLKLMITVDVAPAGGIPSQTVEDTKVALRELGLSDEVEEK